MTEVRASLPLDEAFARALRCGDVLRLQGVLYTARDAAHKRMAELAAKGKAPPFKLAGAALYYAGPTPAPPGGVIGAVGPTTSGRMDAYTPALLDAGLRATIGKGRRSAAVVQAMVRNGAVYLGAPGGAGALLAGCVRRCRAVAFKELGPEAVYRLEVENFPVTVVIDTLGNNLYEQGPASYLAAKGACVGHAE